MTPTSGPVGTNVVITVTSTAFPLDGDYQVRWSSSAVVDDNSAYVLIQKGSNPRSSYSIVVNFNVPEAKYGINYVQLVRFDDILVFQFTVKPTLVVDPPVASPGRTVTVKGMGFPDKDEGTLTFDGLTPGVAFKTNEVGSFTTTFAVPETIAGTHKFVANSKKLYADSASTNLSVEPFVTLNPPNPDIGAEVTLSGGGFAAKSQLSIEYDGKVIAGSPTTDDKGSFTFVFKVTEGSKSEHKIVVTDKAGNTAKYGMPLESIAPPKPAILGPKNKNETFGFSGSAVVTFSWTPVSDPSGVVYELEIGEELTFFPLKPGMRRTGLTDTSITLEIPQGGPYYWRVRAIDGAGNVGEWQISPNSFKVGVIPFWYLIVGGLIILAVFVVLLVAFIRRLKEYYG